MLLVHAGIEVQGWSIVTRVLREHHGLKHLHLALLYLKTGIKFSSRVNYCPEPPIWFGYQKNARVNTLELLIHWLYFYHPFELKLFSGLQHSSAGRQGQMVVTTLSLEKE